VNNVDIARTPSKEVYAQIIADMKEAETLVKTSTEIGSSGQVSKSTVRGILARVFLTMAGAPLHDTEKFKDAREWALKVKESGEHMLNPEFSKIFINECAMLKIIRNVFGRQKPMVPILIHIAKEAA
jgi:hypothetical protein